MEEIGVLFDLDGVIIDSESIYTEFWSSMDRKYPTGIPNFAMAIKGTTLHAILNTYFSDAETQAKIIVALEKFELEMQYHPYSEALRFVNELKENQIKCAIVTSSSEQKMGNLYRQNPRFRQLFDAVVTSDMVSHSKPHPEPYLKGAVSINVPIENCFVFEDSLSGIESGKAAGATVIGMATTLPFCKINGKAHKTIESFTGFHISDLLAAKESD